jgi:hypothetical protein
LAGLKQLSSSYPDGHIDDLAAQVGNVLANLFGTESVCRTVENIAPTTRRCRQSMAASACRMISRSSFPDRELIGLTSRGTSWQNAEQCAQGSAVADSGAGGNSFAKGEAQQGARRGAGSATAPKLV